MELQSTLVALLDILNILAIIPGLLIARPFHHITTAWLSGTKLKFLVASRTTSLILWLAIGALFARPLFDILGWINILTTIFQGSTGMSSFNLGSFRLDAFSMILFLVDLGIYGLICWLDRGWLEKPIHVEALQRNLTHLEKWFALMAMASLVNLIVGGFIVRIVLFYLNHLQTSVFNSLGILLAWALALLLASVLVLVLDIRLTRKEPY